MLILARRAGEEIIITAGDEEIVVTVLEISTGIARVGISAARSVVIERAELRDRQEDGAS